MLKNGIILNILKKILIISLFFSLPVHAGFWHHWSTKKKAFGVLAVAGLCVAGAVAYSYLMRLGKKSDDSDKGSKVISRPSESICIDIAQRTKNGKLFSDKDFRNINREIMQCPDGKIKNVMSNFCVKRDVARRKNSGWLIREVIGSSLRLKKKALKAALQSGNERVFVGIWESLSLQEKDEIRCWLQKELFVLRRLYHEGGVAGSLKTDLLVRALSAKYSINIGRSYDPDFVFVGGGRLRDMRAKKSALEKRFEEKRRRFVSILSGMHDQRRCEEREKSVKEKISMERGFKRNMRYKLAFYESKEKARLDFERKRVELLFVPKDRILSEFKGGKDLMDIYNSISQKLSE